jgi:hypothetical protein
VAELLLINPAPALKRKASKMAKSKKPRSAAQRRATAKLVAMNRAKKRGFGPARKKARRAAKKTTVAAARKRASNPIKSYSRKRRAARRSNPIALGGMGRALTSQFKEALIGGAGSVAVDLAYGQINRFLPAMLQRVPGQVGLGDAVKAVLTVALGQALAKPTRGMSQKMATGALTVQAAMLLRSFVPASMALGYYSPARIMQGTPRVGPIRSGVNAYVPGQPPLLNAYSTGAPALLNGAGGMSSAQQREGVSRHY